MKKMIRSLMVTLIAFLFAAVITNTSTAGTNMPKALTIGTSSIGSTFYIIAVGMADLISKKLETNATAEAVGGSDANMRAINQRVINLAIANTFSSGNAFRGSGQFVTDGKVPLRLIALGQPSLRQVVARTDRGINTCYDLKDKRIAVKRRGMKEIELVANALLKVHNINKADVKYITSARTKEAIDALIAGTIDAAIIPAGIPASTLMKLFEQIDAKFVDISVDKMKEMLKILGPDFHMSIIPRGTYRDQERDVFAPSLSASLVVAEGFPEEAVYQITKALFENYDEFKLVHKTARHWTAQNTLKMFHIPFHSGAIKYFKEISAWTPEHNKKQQELLLDR